MLWITYNQSLNLDIHSFIELLIQTYPQHLNLSTKKAPIIDSSFLQSFNQR